MELFRYDSVVLLSKLRLGESGRGKRAGRHNAHIHESSGQEYKAPLLGPTSPIPELMAMQAIMQKDSLPSWAARGWAGSLHSFPCMAAGLLAGG